MEGIPEIRSLEPREFRDLLPELIQVYLEAYAELGDYYYRSRREARWYLRWLYRGDREGFLVALAWPEVAGFVSVHRSWPDWREGLVAEIHEWVVRPSWQGKGVGMALFSRALELAREAGRRHAALWVGEGNRKARSIYLSHGFEELGQWGKWVRMWLALRS